MTSFWNTRLDRLTADHLVNLLDARPDESHALEFKRGVADTKPVTETLCAFANADGGRLLWGVRDRKEWGQDLPSMLLPFVLKEPRLESTILGTFHACVPALVADFKIVPVAALTGTPDTYVVVVEVPAVRVGMHHASDGVFYLRTGASNMRAPYSTIVRRLADLYARGESGLLPGAGIVLRGGYGQVEHGDARVIVTEMALTPFGGGGPGMSVEVGRRFIEAVESAPWGLEHVELDSIGVTFRGREGSAVLTWRGNVNVRVRRNGVLFEDGDARARGIPGSEYFAVPPEQLATDINAFLLTANRSQAPDTPPSASFSLSVRLCTESQRRISLTPPTRRAPPRPLDARSVTRDVDRADLAEGSLAAHLVKALALEWAVFLDDHLGDVPLLG